MNRYFIPLIAITSLIAVTVILAFVFLEIVPWKKPVPPSSLAMENDFLALERWLNRTGHPARTETRPNASTIPLAGEGVVYVQASFFPWTKQNYELFKPWVESGGRLLIALDREWNKEYSEGMDLLFGDLGIGAAQFFGAEAKAVPKGNGGAEAEPKEDGGAEEKAAPEEDEAKAAPGRPYFDHAIKFDPKELPPGCFSMSDSRGDIRLVSVKMGDGSVTLFGSPVFMMNFDLGYASNARLTWRLTGAGDSEGKGVLFIRGRKPYPGFWGRLAGSGRLLPPLLSFAVVLAVGVWMIVPVFGRLFEKPGPPGKPIGERFLAEARFFRRYGALDSYIEPYRETIKQRLAKKTESPNGNPGEASRRALAELCGIDHTRVDELFKPRQSGPLRPGEFVRVMETVHAILERL
ncbi:MAG: hypothetical protein LBK64_03680 [Spirochaetaceae bacterium]|jgi:hypothetical protein|nr:hypothetical protein [Spirochaetaceae bacterium]